MNVLLRKSDWNFESFTKTKPGGKFRYITPNTVEMAYMRTNKGTQKGPSMTQGLINIYFVIWFNLFFLVSDFFFKLWVNDQDFSHN